MAKHIMVGVDIGTSGTKTILVGPDGRVLASHTAEYPLSTPRPGWAEQEPAHWWAAVVETLKAVLAKANVSRDDLAGLGLSGQMHGMVALDRERRVVRPAILWCDGRTGPQCEAATAAAGGLSGLLQLTNNRMLPGYTGGKILWMREAEPDNYARTALVLNPKDYIRYLLTGALATEVSDASGTGLFNVRERRFSDELLGKLNIPRSFFPKCYESAEVIAGVSAQAAALTGLPEGLPVVGGGGDAVIQTTGTGLVKPGVLGVVIGTSGVVAMGLSGYKRNEGDLQVFCNNGPGLWHAMGVTLAAGGSYRWWRDALCAPECDQARAEGVSPYDVMGRMAQASRPGANRLLFLPYLTGERCPHSDPDARGAFVGLHLQHNKADMTRAVMEGITYSLRSVAELIYAMDPGMPRDKVVASGGGAMSPLWRQVLSDVLQQSVVTLSGSGEGGAYGAALVAGVGCRVFSSLDEAIGVLREETRTEPNPENRAVYQDLYGVYQGLYPAMAASMHALARA